MDQIITLIFKVLQYRKYRLRYDLPKSFRFNGYGIRILGSGKLIAGNDCYVSYFSNINIEEDTKLTLGDKVSIGHYVKIYTSVIDNEIKILNGTEVKKKADIYIGDNVSIGPNVYIAPGVKIESNSIIGPGSVIVSDVPSNSVVLGVPGRVIKRYEK